MHMSSNAMPLLSGPVFGQPVVDSAWRFAKRSRVLHYEVDDFEVRDVHFDCHLVAVALQDRPVPAYRRIGDTRRRELIVPGGAIVVPQGAAHDSQVAGRGVFIMAGVSAETLHDTADMLGIASPTLVPTFPESRDDELTALLCAAADIARIGDLGRSLELETCLHRLAVRLLSRFSSRAAGSRSLNLGLAPWQLRRVTDFVQAHLASAIGIDELAREVSVSRHHFLRQFRRSTGQTPGQFVIEARMALARHQLVASAAPVSNIAASCGFSTEAHFSHTFRKRYGQTPSQFRQNGRREWQGPS